MNHEEHSVYVDRQKEINRKAKEGIEKSLRSLNVSMILSDKARAKKRFISAVVKYTDRFFTESLENGRALKQVKLAD